jgi:hypothetical protein
VTTTTERPIWNAHLTVRKYEQAAAAVALAAGYDRPDDDVFASLGLEPFETVDNKGNILVTAGIGRIATLLNAGTGNLISTTTARVGAGNSATAEAIGQTDLQAAAGSTNRWFQTCTVTIPSNVLTFVAVFASADGNFAWSEWGIDIGTATVTSGNTVNPVLLNRKVASNGTKVGGQVWTATATITFA